MSGETVDRLASQPDAAVRRSLEPDDDLQEGALAGPVRTDDGDDVAVVDPERDAVDGRETAEAFRDRIDLEEQTPASATTQGDTASTAAISRALAATTILRCSALSRAAGLWSGRRTGPVRRPSHPMPSTAAATRIRGC
jgi:hypothetical protein